MEAWKRLEPGGRKHRGLVSLMRRRPDRLDPDQALRLRAYLDESILRRARSGAGDGIRTRDANLGKATTPSTFRMLRAVIEVNRC